MNLNRSEKRYMVGISTFVEAAKANAGAGKMIFCPCKDCKNHRMFAQPTSVRTHLLMRGFMPNYRIWCMHGEAGVNVAETFNDDVDMPDMQNHVDVNVPQINTNDELVVNTSPELGTNSVFANTLANDTEEDDAISLMLRNADTGFLSDSQMKKLEKMRQDDKTYTIVQGLYSEQIGGYHHASRV